MPLIENEDNNQNVPYQRLFGQTSQVCRCNFLSLCKCLNVTFIISGILGEVDLAAQHVMVEIGEITFMVCIIQCVHWNIYGHIII